MEFDQADIYQGRSFSILDGNAELFAPGSEAFCIVNVGSQYPSIIWEQISFDSEQKEINYDQRDYIISSMVRSCGTVLSPPNGLILCSKYPTLIILHLQIMIDTQDIFVNVWINCKNSCNTTVNIVNTPNDAEKDPSEVLLGSFSIPLVGIGATPSALTWYPVSHADGTFCFCFFFLPVVC